MLKKQKPMAWAALGAALVMVTAACSSSKKAATSATTASSSPASPSTTRHQPAHSAYMNTQGGTEAQLRGTPGTGLTRGVTDTEVTLGCVYQGAYYPGLDTGFKAKINTVNKTGGRQRPDDQAAAVYGRQRRQQHHAH